MAYYAPATTIHGEAPVNILSDDVRQLYSDTCAIKSQQLILQDFGFNISEDQLRNEAMMNGWYDGGTSPADVGKLLELHGVGIHNMIMPIFLILSMNYLLVIRLLLALTLENYGEIMNLIIYLKTIRQIMH